MENIYFSEDGYSLRQLLDGESEVLAVLDMNAAPHFRNCLEECGVPYLPFLSSEDRKSPEGLLEVAEWLLEHEADRSALLVGIGGGVVTDLTGFAATVFKRGIRYALVPTTLLAQADASIGGKTGIDFKGYKNVLGTFGTPEWVFMDSAPLLSLPAFEFHSGLAEVLKTFVIGDAQMFRMTVEHFGASTWTWHAGALESDMPFLRKAVRRCAAIKASITGADRTEKWDRMKLNLGHTLGHALESLCLCSGSPVSHGEAVAAGIIAAAGVSERMNLLSREVSEEIVSGLKSLGYKDLKTLADEHCGHDRQQVLSKLSDFVLNDKKRKEDFINFVFIHDIGCVTVSKLDVREVQEVINDLY